MDWREQKVKMKNYVVVFLRNENHSTGIDTFCGISESEARHAFRECYRHGTYKILGVLEIPEKE